MVFIYIFIFANITLSYLNYMKTIQPNCSTFYGISTGAIVPLVLYLIPLITSLKIFDKVIKNNTTRWVKNFASVDDWLQIFVCLSGCVTWLLFYTTLKLI